LRNDRSTSPTTTDLDIKYNNSLARGDMVSLEDFIFEEAWLDRIVEKLELLEPHKVLHDKIWRRIWLTGLEIRLMDTEEFQRLHWKLQLGTTLFVYPCASHTRFEHSVGSLSGTEEVIRACSRNSKRYGARWISPYEHFLARLAALLHDLAQMAFGHTFEKEGHLFKVEWNCRKVKRRLISPEGLIPTCMRQYLIGRWELLPDAVSQKISTEQFVECVRFDLDWIFSHGLSGRVRKIPQSREYLAFISDIVGNTLSGDLLDYVQRDYATLGLTEDRVSLIPLEFAIVTDARLGRFRVPRLVVTLWKPTKPEKVRKEVMRYIVRLFDKRCTLAEDVYFHHAKAAASAMLIKAVHLSGMTCEDIWQCGDAQLLDELAAWKEGSDDPEETEKSKAIRSLASNIKKRHLYKNVFEAKQKKIIQERKTRRIRRYCSKGNGPQEQRRLEKDIASYFSGISDSQVVVYCPDPSMNLKSFDTLIWQTREEVITPLKNSAETTPAEIIARHRQLWGITVFVDPTVLSGEKRSQIRTICNCLLLEESPYYPISAIWMDGHISRL